MSESNTDRRIVPLPTKQDVLTNLLRDGAAVGAARVGAGLRFPRIVRWRHDKAAAEADRLEALYPCCRRRERVAGRTPPAHRRPCGGPGDEDIRRPLSPREPPIAPHPC